MGTTSHHSHSGQFCKHAKGTLREMVVSAINKGFSSYGLSEHCPRPNDQDLYPEEEGLTPEDLVKQYESFLVEAYKLKEEFKEKIDLLVGLETENIRPGDIEYLNQFRKQHDQKIQYVVGSVHHWRNTPIDFSKEILDAKLKILSKELSQSLSSTSTEQKSSVSGWPLVTLETYWDEYFDNQYDLIEGMHPEVIGHMDLCRIYFPEERFEQFPSVMSKIERNIKAVISYGGLFEVSSAAFRKGWSSGYPGQEVLQLILKLGGRLALSDDAHYPEGVGLHYDKLYDYLKSNNVHELWRLRTKDGGVLTETMPLPWDNES